MLFCSNIASIYSNPDFRSFQFLFSRSVSALEKFLIGTATRGRASSRRASAETAGASSSPRTDLKSPYVITVIVLNFSSSVRSMVSLISLISGLITDPQCSYTVRITFCPAFFIVGFVPEIHVFPNSTTVFISKFLIPNSPISLHIAVADSTTTLGLLPTCFIS